MCSHIACVVWMMTGGAGTSALVEAIDIMPTILAEAGISAPACPPTHAASRATAYCVEGKSLSPLLREPSAPAVLAKFSAAYSQVRFVCYVSSVM